MHLHTESQRNRAMHGWVIDDLTNFPGQGAPVSPSFAETSWSISIEFGKITDQSAALPEFVFDFRCWSVLKRGRLKWLGSQIDAKFRAFHPLPPYKITGGVGQISESVFQVQSRTQPWVYFWRNWHLAAREIRGPVKDEAEQHFIRRSSTTSRDAQ